MTGTDEWPPKKARTMEAWKAYWSRQRWDRRFIHDHVRPWLDWLSWKLSAPRRWRRQARWFIQRGRRGWADYDMWGMHGYICRVLGEMSLAMKDSHSHPCLGRQEDCWRHDSEPCGCEQEWIQILDSTAKPLLAWGSHEDWPDGETYEEHNERELKVTGEAQQALRKLADYLPNLWD